MKLKFFFVVFPTGLPAAFFNFFPPRFHSFASVYSECVFIYAHMRISDTIVGDDTNNAFNADAGMNKIKLNGPAQAGQEVNGSIERCNLKA